MLTVITTGEFYVEGIYLFDLPEAVDPNKVLDELKAECDTDPWESDAGLDANWERRKAKLESLGGTGRGEDSELVMAWLKSNGYPQVEFRDVTIAST